MNWTSIESEQTSTIPHWVTPKNTHLTLVKLGYVPACDLLHIPGLNKEHELFNQQPSGRMQPDEWADFVADIEKHGNTYPILLIADLDGFHVHEGNHRIRAALTTGKDVYTELRCFANVAEPN
jgi:ParB-like nuclease domain.